MSTALSSVKSQKIVLFIAISVRIAKPLLRFLCQVFLGEGTVKDEEQIVEVYACGRTGRTRMPISRLQGGLIENFPLKLKFSNSPITFKLIKGSGPVHLIGIHMFGKLDPLWTIIN
jgi:hypothetical protein